MAKQNSNTDSESILIFMLMPFSENLTDIYKTYIRAPLTSLGHIVKRADDFYRSTDILSDILKCIESANIIVADLTGRNPNVFYELGIAHHKQVSNVILICQKESDIPFDLRGKRTIIYENSPEGYESLKKRLLKFVKVIIEEVPLEQPSSFNLTSLDTLSDREIIDSIRTMKRQQISDLIVKMEFDRLFTLIKLIIAELSIPSETPKLLSEKIEKKQSDKNLYIFITKSVLLRFKNDEKIFLFKFLFENLNILESFTYDIYEDFINYTKDSVIKNYIKENNLIDYFIDLFVNSKTRSFSETMIAILLNFKDIMNLEQLKRIARGAIQNDQIYGAVSIPYKMGNLLSGHLQSLPEYIKKGLRDLKLV